jgi:hypothetical protein
MNHIFRNAVLVTVFALLGASAAMSQTANYPEVQLQPSYNADTGLVNVLTATVTSCPSAYVTGMVIKMLPLHANTTTTPTLNFCGLGAKTITKFGIAAVAANDLITTEISIFVYDGTYMELTNPATLSSVGGGISFPQTVSGTTYQWGIPYFSSTTTLTAGPAPTLTNGPLLGNTAGAPSWSGIGWLTTATAYEVPYMTSTTQMGGLAMSATASFPMLSGAAAAPTWATIQYLSSGTSGGIPYLSSATALNSSGLLTQYGLLLGGGSGGAPTSTAQGASNMPLIGQGAAAPIFSTIGHPSSCATGNLLYGSSATQLACLTGLISNSSGMITTYDGIATAGLGLVTVEGVSDKTAQSGSLTAQNLVASTGAAGHYLVRLYMDQNALCTTGTGSVYATVTWTDATASHTATTIPLTLANTAISSANGFVDAAIPFWSAASDAVSYTTTYTACTSGTGTYDLHAELERTN